MLFAIFRVTDHTGLDAYFWLSPQGVIWIAWIGFAAQLFVLALFYHYSTTVALSWAASSTRPPRHSRLPGRRGAPRQFAAR